MGLLTNFKLGLAFYTPLMSPVYAIPLVSSLVNMDGNLVLRHLT